MGSEFICRVDNEFRKLDLFEEEIVEVYRDCYKYMVILNNDDQNPIKIISNGVEVDLEFFKKRPINIFASESQICFSNDKTDCFYEINEEIRLNGNICFMNHNESNYFCENFLDNKKGYSILTIEKSPFNLKKNLN